MFASQLAQDAQETLQSFFGQHASDSSWEKSWQLVLNSLSDSAAASGEHIWDKMIEPVREAIARLTLEERKRLLLSRVVYEAHRQGIVFYYPSELPESQSHQLNLPSRLEWQDGVGLTASGNSYQGLIARGLEGARLALWRKHDGTLIFRPVLLSTEPEQLWAFRAYENIQESSPFWGERLHANCLKRFNGAHLRARVT